MAHAAYADPLLLSKERSLVIRLITERFQKYGYDEIRLNTLEEVGRFKASDKNMIRVQALHDYPQLALVPDLTFLAAHWVLDNEAIGSDRQCRVFYTGICYRPSERLSEKGRTAPIAEVRQIGLEHFNRYSPKADAEVILVALDVLDALGLDGYRLKIGNMDILLQILSRYPRYIRQEILQDLHTLTLLDDNYSYLKNLEENTGQVECEEYLEDLRGILVQKFGERVSEDTAADDLGLGKQWLDQVLQQYGRKWREVNGIDPEMVGQLQNLLNAKNENFDCGLKDIHTQFPALCPASLERVKEIRRLISLRRKDLKHCQLDVCLTRNLDYYTDLVFSIYHETPFGLKHVCGGGRYDNLLSDVSASARSHRGEEVDVPATGFAIDLDGIMALLSQKEDRSLGSPRQVGITISFPPEMYAEAGQLADELRKYADVSEGVHDLQKAFQAAFERERVQDSDRGLFVAFDRDLWEGDKKIKVWVLSATIGLDSKPYTVTVENLSNILETWTRFEHYDKP